MSSGTYLAATSKPSPRPSLQALQQLGRHPQRRRRMPFGRLGRQAARLVAFAGVCVASHARFGEKGVGARWAQAWCSSHAVAPLVRGRADGPVVRTYAWTAPTLGPAASVIVAGLFFFFYFFLCFLLLGGVGSLRALLLRVLGRRGEWASLSSPHRAAGTTPCRRTLAILDRAALRYRLFERAVSQSHTVVST